jgi:alpha-D-ribose 1-methylphosphonate 5-triphosphate diphosphatase
MWLSDLRLVLPDRIIEQGALLLQDGRIAEVREGNAPPSAYSLRGLTVIPGIIDLHGDMLERDIEPRPRARFPIEMALHELDKRLVGTGITTAYAAISFAWNKSDLRRQETAIEIIRIVNQTRDTLLADFKVHARFEVNNRDTVGILERLVTDNQVDLVSIMDHTPGQGQYGDTRRYVQFLIEWLNFTDEQLAPIYARMEQKVAELKVTPRDWSVVRGVVGTARSHGIVVASHDDDTVEKVHDQAEMGVTISEFPVNIEAAFAARERGMHVIMGAPNAYRGESNTGNLSALDAIRAGAVDILATDYFPAAPLQAAFRLAQNGVLPLYESVRLVTVNPADAVGLTDRGRIAVGCRADLVLIEEGTYPRVRATLRNGKLIYSDSEAVRFFQLPTISAS